MCPVLIVLVSQCGSPPSLLSLLLFEFFSQLSVFSVQPSCASLLLIAASLPLIFDASPPSASFSSPLCLASSSSRS